MQGKMMVKLVILALCYCYLSTIADENADEVAAMKAVSRCQEQLKISDEKIQELHKQNMILKDSSDEEGKCFVECMMKEFKLINSDGAMNTEEVMNNSKGVIESMQKRGKNVNEDTLRKTMEECNNKASGEQGRCAASYMIWECLHDKMQETLGS